MSLRSQAVHFVCVAVLVLAPQWAHAGSGNSTLKAPPLVTVGYDEAFDLFNLLDNLPD